MKKLFLTLSFIAIIASASAQNAIAKIKYEEAEEAYSIENFELTLTRLAEVEALLKSSNPKVMYLRILAQSKVISLDPTNSFAIIEDTRNLSSKYLKDYEAVPDIETKYRDIYKISESLKAYPATPQEFEDYRKKIASDEAERSAEEVTKANDYEKAFLNFVYFDRYVIGLTEEETIARYPEFKKHQTFKNTDDRYEYLLAPKTPSTRNNSLMGFTVKNKKVIGYFGIIVSDIYDPETATDEASGKVLDKLIADIRIVCNCDPTITVLESKIPGHRSANLTTYSWEKKNKGLYVGHTRFVKDNGSVNNFISILSLDQDLAK